MGHRLNRLPQNLTVSRHSFPDRKCRMRLTPAQGAMFMMLGTELPRLQRKALEETISDGRAMLRRITGRDFFYDLHAWHRYLSESADGLYCWCDGHLHMPEQIEAAIQNADWQHAVERLLIREQQWNQERAGLE